MLNKVGDVPGELCDGWDIKDAAGSKLNKAPSLIDISGVLVNVLADCSVVLFD